MAIPPQVMEAFGARGPVVLLPAGERRTYRCGSIVLRRENPAEVADALLAADVFAGIGDDAGEFRVPRPLRTRAGGWLTDDGWAAWTFVEGRQAEARDAAQMVLAINAFHRAIAHVPCPAYLRGRALVYDRADRGAFGELPEGIDGRLRSAVDALYAMREPLDGLSDQLIHGDANAANFLVADGLPPAVIDFAPYWRPAEFAPAVTAFWLCGYQGHTEALSAFRRIQHFEQLLLRALIRSLLVLDGFGGADRLLEYEPSIRLVRQLVG